MKTENLSNSGKGNEFRDEVAELLKLTPNISNVRTEVPVGSQDVDIYYEESTSIRTYKIACECKNYSKPLTRSTIASNIFPRYNPLLEGKKVDAVRIIAPLELGANAQAYVEDCGFSFVTRNELETRLIDFRVYMRSLMSLYQEDGLDEYYIKPALADGADLEEQIKDWIKPQSCTPIAILAGYGMGKTSFARRLAYIISKQNLEGSIARIPILIPLSEISSEQGLEGLLGKLLAAQNLVPNYHFNLFMKLNSLGRFLIILDGFDEMKHTMSWNEFRHNFSQLNRLVIPGSRVLLLGRPSALLSDAEELFVLKGQRQQGRKTFTIPGAPKYQEISLQPFSLEQSITFIHGYAGFRVRESSLIRGHQPDDVESRLSAIREDTELKALIKRPVQAKMLADLAIDPEVQWRSFSRYELYEEFVSRIIDREVEKPTRLSFSVDQRIEFIRIVAWWLWQQAGRSGFELDDLPSQIIELFCDGENDDRDGVRRDLVSGSLLEKKAGERFYFPHRSFLEFLVAQRIIFNEWSGRNLADISAALTPEIIEFVRESEESQKVCEWNEKLNESTRPLSTRFLSLVAWAINSHVGGDLPESTSVHASPRELLVTYFRHIEARTSLSSVVNVVTRSFAKVKDRQTQLMCILCLLVAKESSKGTLRDSLNKYISALVLERACSEIERIAQGASRTTQSINMDDSFARLVAIAFKADTHPSGNEIFLGIDGSKLFSVITEDLDPKWRLEDLEEQLSFTVEIVKLSELGQLVKKLRISEKGGHVAKFFRNHPNPSKLVSVTFRSKLQHLIL